MSTILSDEALNELLASSRAHGTYDEALHNFAASGEKGVQVSLVEGTFAGKKAPSVKTGFNSALERTTAMKKDGVTPAGTPLPEGVEIAIIAKNDQVYLIRRDLVKPTAPAAPAAPTES